MYNAYPVTMVTHPYMTPLIIVSSAKKKTKKQPVRIRAMTWVHPYLIGGCIYDIAPF